MNKSLELNRIALWRPKFVDELTVRECGAGRPYVENHVIKKTLEKTYRYAKNYEKGKHKFCLFVITYSNDADTVVKQLDATAKKIKVSEIESVISDSEYNNFKYTDFKLEEK